jgi:hypothetical protein
MFHIEFLIKSVVVEFSGIFHIGMRKYKMRAFSNSSWLSSVDKQNKNPCYGRLLS